LPVVFNQKNRLFPWFLDRMADPRFESNWNRIMFDKRNDTKQGTSGDNASAVPASSTKSTSALAGTPAVIGAGISINGDISGTESLLVEGKIEGKISLPGHQVEVGQTGKVNADILAKFVKVNGELKGDIEGREKVVITKSGNVRGNISAPRVMLEDGAIFKGSIDIDPAESAPVELPLTPQKAKDNVKNLGADSTTKDVGHTAKGA
jgi:cytoskeletal protein CcmA (bactofilin family)